MEDLLSRLDSIIGDTPDDYCRRVDRVLYDGIPSSRRKECLDDGLHRQLVSRCGDLGDPMGYLRAVYITAYLMYVCGSSDNA
ncbi:MAG: uncharacterized protein KVP18_002719 [Porospora cf. gigantea A]|nr:MAG: hypothetical protein KVP18_002719 [Porospora cf. gigantea A]